ncbi:MAG TPA: hypothetical protein VKE93_00280 [Candidatus Angelobacter sp.]|nr:hypothetical protein [Candidatus Angelobacter sp.]
MITKGGDAIQKHLTIEVQDLLKSRGKANPLRAYMAAFKADSGAETFDSGDVLLAYSDPSKKLKYELHVDSDDLAGNEETLLLSIHTFSDGKEQEDMWGLLSSHFSVSMQLQENVWRLNKISIGAEFPLGDPNFIQKALLSTGSALTSAAFYTPQTELRVESASAQHESPPMAPSQVVTLLGFGETIFARLHPEMGFTCSLSDLAEASKMMGVDQQVVSGVYNGYRFALSGCEGKPAGSFQISAEPLVPKPGMKAFCTDATQNLRTEETGRAPACLVSGKVENNQTGEGGSVDWTSYTPSSDRKK